MQLAGVDDAGPLKIDERQIGVGAHREAALARPQTPGARRPLGHRVDEALEGQVATGNGISISGSSVSTPAKPAGTSQIDARLLVSRAVRRMVAGEHVDRPSANAARSVMASVAAAESVG